MGTPRIPSASGGCLRVRDRLTTMPEVPDLPRWLDYMRVRDLPPAMENPKGHDLDYLDASIDRFGYVDPVELDERTGRLVAGHGRRESLLRLEERHEAGEPPPNGILVDEDGGWRVPVVRGWSSANDAEAEAYLIGNNRGTELGGWLEEQLASMLDRVNASGGLAGVGYTVEQLDDMRARYAGPPDLDALAGQVGAPDPTAFWPVLRFKVPPGLRARYLALVAGVDGGDADQFEQLVAWAEAATAKA